ncbi:PhzF family phenazine biosynthesis protein [Ferrimicrobium sp.]|uniref:PhzF family phenazine biosynthesis protein n=1 Tax=Ferrimicrobium sp. TaxID=2926050 RepID=UPI0026310B0F|nr:PhzF family phenazine biosynthesis protein [Ferrimicrobium sp.]
MPLISELMLIDAFATRPFTGNPAAVALCDYFPGDSYLQAIAAEINLSETAFCVPRPDGAYDLRWFTPTTEVALCGHATLASAHVLGGEAAFHTASGILTCSRGDNGEINMDFPLDPPTAIDPLPEYSHLAPVWTGRGLFDLLIVVDDPDSVKSYTPDPVILSRAGTRCVIITAPSEQPTIDCVSRVFAPNVGVLEDPVTGSAHCTLAAYWGQRLGKNRLYGEQASPRGGFVSMSVKGDRVTLGGRCVTVGRLELMIE